MSTYFSEKFKQLRKSSDFTQEQIADIFHVSPQSVSRWETGANYPDTEMLPHIAVFFKVTVDELLGTVLIAGEEKAKKYIADIRNLLNSGKLIEAIDTARKATKEYPLNTDLHWLLVQSLGTEPESEKHKDEIIAISERMINLTDYKSSLVHRYQLVRHYGRWGMKEEAKKMADTLPNCAYNTQELVMLHILDGDELVKDLKHRIVRFAIMLSGFVNMYADKADLDILQKIECKKAVIQIEAMPSAVAGCDWVDTAWRAHLNIFIAELYCSTGDGESALDYVENATQDAMLHVEQMYETTANGSNYMAFASPRNLPWILWEEHLMKPQFDFIRNDDRFIKCFDTLKTNSHELK
jgi:transcriptional regulator with XRE-family HTH domain